MFWERDERQRINAMKRSFRMAQARQKGTHTKNEWLLLREMFGCCVHCGTTEYNLEKDHIMPVYQGGSDAIENIQPSCARCNARKGPECIDKRLLAMPDWIALFECRIDRELLKDENGTVCLAGSQG